MSTLAASPQFGATRERTTPRPAEASIFHLILSYIVVMLLIFFSTRGAFSFEFVGASAGSADADIGGPVKWVTVVIAFATILLLLYPVAKPLWRSVVQYRILLVLPIWATLTVLWSHYQARTLAAGIQATVLTLFGFYIPVRFNPKQQMQLFVAAGLMTTLLSFATVAIYPRAGIDHKNSTIGVQGIFPQKNICAVITIELLVVGFCYAFKGKNAPFKRIAFITLLTALILSTMARTGWILLVLVVGFIWLLQGLHKLRPIERFAVTWFVPALSILGGYLIYINSAAFLALIGKGATLSGRTGVWSVVFLAIVKRPILGFGYAAFWVPGNFEASRLGALIGDPGLNNAENGVLQLWLEVGLIGVAIMMFLLFRSCKNAIACYRSNTPNYAIWYMTILFITLLALVDGSKFMLWTSLDWMMYIMADIGLANEARRVKAIRTASV